MNKDQEAYRQLSEAYSTVENRSIVDENPQQMDSVEFRTVAPIEEDSGRDKEVDANIKKMGLPGLGQRNPDGSYTDTPGNKEYARQVAAKQKKQTLPPLNLPERYAQMNEENHGEHWTLITVGGRHSEITTIDRRYGVLSDEEAEEEARRLVAKIKEENPTANHFDEYPRYEDFEESGGVPGWNPHEIDLPMAIGSWHITPDGHELVKHRGEKMD